MEDSTLMGCNFIKNLKSSRNVKPAGRKDYMRAKTATMHVFLKRLNIHIWAMSTFIFYNFSWVLINLERFPRQNLVKCGCYSTCGYYSRTSFDCEFTAMICLCLQKPAQYSNADKGKPLSLIWKPVGSFLRQLLPYA